MDSKSGNTLLPIYERFVGRQMPGKAKPPGTATGRSTSTGTKS
jgi:hypothetical protein